MSTAKTIDANDEDAIVKAYEKIAAARAQEAAEKAAVALTDRRARFAPVIEFAESEQLRWVREQAMTISEGLVIEPNTYNAMRAIAAQIDTLGLHIPGEIRQAG